MKRCDGDRQVYGNQKRTADISGSNEFVERQHFAPHYQHPWQLFLGYELLLVGNDNFNSLPTTIFYAWKVKQPCAGMLRLLRTIEACMSQPGNPVTKVCLRPAGLIL